MADHPAAIEQDLRRFLRAGASRRFDWLSCNCGFWVCEWIALRRGVDPVADIRGQFDRPEAFLRHVSAAGGNEAFSRGIASRAGLTETIAPARGDVGLIRNAAGATMAICVGDGRWAAKSPHGLVVSPFGCVIAWAL